MLEKIAPVQHLRVCGCIVGGCRIVQWGGGGKDGICKKQT